MFEKYLERICARLACTYFVRNLNEPTINHQQRNDHHPSKHETGSSDHYLSSNTTIEERIVDCWPVALIFHLQQNGV
jgi:hypothetical protein